MSLFAPFSASGPWYERALARTRRLKRTETLDVWRMKETKDAKAHRHGNRGRINGTFLYIH